MKHPNEKAPRKAATFQSAGDEYIQDKIITGQQRKQGDFSTAVVLDLLGDSHQPLGAFGERNKGESPQRFQSSPYPGEPGGVLHSFSVGAPKVPAESAKRGKGGEFMSQEKTSCDKTIQEALRLVAMLTPEQREEYLVHLRAVANEQRTGNKASGEIPQ